MPPRKQRKADGVPDSQEINNNREEYEKDGFVVDEEEGSSFGFRTRDEKLEIDNYIARGQFRTIHVPNPAVPYITRLQTSLNETIRRVDLVLLSFKALNTSIRAYIIHLMTDLKEEDLLIVCTDLDGINNSRAMKIFTAIGLWFEDVLIHLRCLNYFDSGIEEKALFKSFAKWDPDHHLYPDPESYSVRENALKSRFSYKSLREDYVITTYAIEKTLDFKHEMETTVLKTVSEFCCIARDLIVLRFIF